MISYVDAGAPTLGSTIDGTAAVLASSNNVFTTAETQH